VAFYFVGEEPKEGVFRPLGGQITAAIVRSGEYIAVDRTSELRRLLSDERKYQMSGAVDENQMSELGKEWGVKYVISIEVTKSMDGFYIEARMVDVEGSYIAKMGNVESKLRNSQDVNDAAEKIVSDLLGEAKRARGSKVGTAGRGKGKMGVAVGVGIFYVETYDDYYGYDEPWTTGGFDIAFSTDFPFFADNLSLNGEIRLSIGAEVFIVSIPLLFNYSFADLAGLPLYVQAGIQPLYDIGYDFDFGLAFGGGFVFNPGRTKIYVGYRGTFGVNLTMLNSLNASFLF
jgi:TolB-like protein